MTDRRSFLLGLGASTLALLGCARRARDRGTRKGSRSHAGRAPRRAAPEGIDILRFANGKLTDRWGRFDDLGLLQQLGAVIAPPR